MASNNSLEVIMRDKDDIDCFLIQRLLESNIHLINI